MEHYFSGQLDFVAFLYALAYVLPASAAFFLRKVDSARLPWGWMVMFSVALGLYA